jgi:hypothetical protein
MRRRTTTLLALGVIACGGSEQEASPPSGTQGEAAQAPAAAARRPGFPAEDRFRLGEPVSLTGSSSAECAKLYLDDTVVAIVETWMHTGRTAVLRRCVGSGWTDPDAPAASELADVGSELAGSLAVDFDGLGIDADGGLTFTPLGLADRVTELVFAGRLVAYSRTAGPREAAGDGQEADVIGVVYDLPARLPLQEFLLGTCSLPTSGALTLPDATWSADARAVTFHGVGGCSFEDVETHPE